MKRFRHNGCCAAKRTLHRCGLAFCALVLAASAGADSGRLLLLHTNDLHDHLRPGYIGIGGLPYVSGFVRSVRAQRDDVLLVDAGDLLEKGDLLAYRTLGSATFEAMGRIGYDAITIGNHDLDFGVEHLRYLEGKLGQPLLLLNLVDRYGEPMFQPSRIVEVNGVKVGLIGMLAPRKKFLGGLDADQSGQALAAEAERLKEQVHIVVAVCHEGPGPIKNWARMAPAVDVFVAGHHHETLTSPRVFEESGAIVVSAGSNGNWVGHLELEVDLEGRRVVDHRGGLDLMRHDRVDVDEDMLQWLEAMESEWAPEAGTFVADLQSPLGWFALGGLAAEAVRARAGADIGFYHPTQIIRNGLAAGPVDYNAIFRISAERVDPLLRLRMTGQEITEYMTALAMSDWGQSQWAGFRVSVRQGDDGRTHFDNDLVPERVYTVVMPEREWQRYLIEIFEPAYVRTRGRVAGETSGRLPRRNLSGDAVDFVFADAFSEYLRAVVEAGETVSGRLKRLRSAQGDADPNAKLYEPRFLQALDPEHFQVQQADGRSLLVTD